MDPLMNTDALPHSSGSSQAPNNGLVASPPHPETNEVLDKALLEAWTRLYDFDVVSSEQKRIYQVIRIWIIVLSTLATALAVLLSTTDSTNFATAVIYGLPLVGAVVVLSFAWRFLRRSPKPQLTGGEILAGLLRWLGYFGIALLVWLGLFGLLQFGLRFLISPILQVVLIVMPIASVILIHYAAKYANSGWIEYRFAAETLRSDIYRYRMNVGDFRDKTPFEKRELLRQITADTYKLVPPGVRVPDSHSHDDDVAAKKAICERLLDSPGTGEDDDGFNKISIEKYVEWRIIPQRTWYINKVNEDFRAKRQATRIALIVSGLGSVLAAFGTDTAQLVALTTAIGLNLTMIGNVRGYGATYGIFHEAQLRLKDMLTHWDNLKSYNLITPETEIAFVENVEKIFEEERIEWHKQAKQMQQIVEQAHQGEMATEQ